MQILQDETTERKFQMWAQIIKECEKRPSGVSQRQWLSDKGISRGAYYYWCKKFSQSSLDNSSDGGINETDITSARANDFVDITDLVNREPESSAPAVQTCGFPASNNISHHPNHLHETSKSSPSTGLRPEAMIEAHGNSIYLFSSIRKETLQTIMEVLHVC